MDFGFSEEQLAVSEAATGLFGGLVDPERVAAVEQSDDRIDRDLWQALAGADLLGLAVPESDGGAGHGLLELCLLLEAQGNAVAPVPLWATLVLGALPHRALRLGRRSGRAGCPASSPATSSSPPRSTGARVEPDVDATRRGPRPTGDGWILEGTELAVPQAHLAARIVVPASDRRRRPARPGGPARRRRDARAHGDDEPRDPPPPPPRAASASRPTTSWRHPHAGRAVLDDLAGRGHHRAVRAAGRRLRVGAAPRRPPT